MQERGKNTKGMRNIPGAQTTMKFEICYVFLTKQMTERHYLTNKTQDGKWIQKKPCMFPQEDKKGKLINQSARKMIKS